MDAFNNANPFPSNVRDSEETVEAQVPWTCLTWILLRQGVSKSQIYEFVKSIDSYWLHEDGHSVKLPTSMSGWTIYGLRVFLNLYERPGVIVYRDGTTDKINYINMTPSEALNCYNNGKVYMLEDDHWSLKPAKNSRILVMSPMDDVDLLRGGWGKKKEKQNKKQNNLKQTQINELPCYGWTGITEKDNRAQQIFVSDKKEKKKFINRVLKKVVTSTTTKEKKDHLEKKLCNYYSASDTLIDHLLDTPVLSGIGSIMIMIRSYVKNKDKAILAALMLQMISVATMTDDVRKFISQYTPSKEDIVAYLKKFISDSVTPQLSEQDTFVASSGFLDDFKAFSASTIGKVMNKIMSSALLSTMASSLKASLDFSVASSLLSSLVRDFDVFDMLITLGQKSLEYFSRLFPNRFVNTVRKLDDALTFSRLHPLIEASYSTTPMAVSIGNYLPYAEGKLPALLADYAEYERIAVAYGYKVSPKFQSKYSDMKVCSEAGKPRDLPFGIALIGPPATGKTTFVEEIWTISRQEWGLDETARCTTIPAETKFDDPYAGEELVLLDDIGAAKVAQTAHNPFERLIPMCQSVVTFSNQAEAQNKGVVPWRIKTFCVTSNVKNLGVEHYMNDTRAVLRRFPIILEIRPKAEDVYTYAAEDMTPDHFENDFVYSFQKVAARFDEHQPFVPIVSVIEDVRYEKRSEALRHIRDRMRAHIVEIRRIQAGMRDPFCTECFLRPCECARDEGVQEQKDNEDEQKDNEGEQRVNDVEEDFNADEFNFASMRAPFYCASRYTDMRDKCSVVLQAKQAMPWNDCMLWTNEMWFYVAVLCSFLWTCRNVFVKCLNAFLVFVGLYGFVCNFIMCCMCIYVFRKILQKKEKFVTYFEWIRFVLFNYLYWLYVIDYCVYYVKKIKIYIVTFRERDDYEQQLKKLRLVLIGAVAVISVYKAYQYYNKNDKTRKTNKNKNNSLEKYLKGEYQPAQGTSTHGITRTRKRTVRITVGLNVNYGYHYDNNHILTVAHMFPDEIPDVQVEYDGDGTKFSLPGEGNVFFDRGLDIALIRVKDGQHRFGSLFNDPTTISNIPLDKNPKCYVYDPQNGAFFDVLYKSTGSFAYGDNEIRPPVVYMFDSPRRKVGRGDCGLIVTDIQGNSVGMVVASTDTNTTFLCVPFPVCELSPRCNEKELMKPSRPGTQTDHVVFEATSSVHTCCTKIGYVEKMNSKTKPTSAKKSLLAPMRLKICGSVLDSDLFSGPKALQAVNGESIRNKVWDQYVRVSENMKTRPCLLDQTLLDKCVDDYFNRIMMCLREEDKVKIKPVTFSEGLLGYVDGEDLPSVRKFRGDTSIGYPFSGQKSDFMEVKDLRQFDDGGYYVEMDPNFESYLLEFEELLLSGQTPFTYVKAHPKDEVVKVSKDKTRIFYIGDSATYCVTRKYLWWINYLVYNHPIAFEQAYGINPYSQEWKEMKEHTNKHRYHMAADFSDWDTRLPQQLMRAAFQILRRLMRINSGLFPDEKFWDALEELYVTPVVLFGNKLYVTQQGTASGHPLTYIMNSMANSLRERYCFYSLFPNLKFDEHVSCMFGGDDADVTTSLREYNQLSTLPIMLSMGLKPTDSSKQQITEEFMEKSEVTFLKRNQDGQIDPISIHKMLSWTMSSDQLEHARGAIVSALYELHMYGRKVFDDFVRSLKEELPKAGLYNAANGVDMSSYIMSHLKTDERDFTEYDDPCYDFESSLYARKVEMRYVQKMLVLEG